MAELKFSVKGLDKIRGSIADMEERAKNLEPVLKGRAQTLMTMIDDSFVKGRSPAGNKWAPLAPSTVKKKRKNSDKILVDTGVMRQSVFAKAEGRSILFGVSGEATKRAAVHIFGRDVRRRSFLPVDGKGTPVFNQGPALKWIKRLRKRIITYIIRGKV